MKKSTPKKRRRSGHRKTQIDGKKVNVSKNKDLSTAETQETGKKEVPSSPKKEPIKKKEKNVPGIRYFKIAGQFLREARVELKKVKWPTKKELLAVTAMVLVLVLFVAVYLGAIDFGLLKIIKIIIG